MFAEWHNNVNDNTGSSGKYKIVNGLANFKITWIIIIIMATTTIIIIIITIIILIKLIITRFTFKYEQW